MLPTLSWYEQQEAALHKLPFGFGDEGGLLGHLYAVKSENICQVLTCEMAP